MTDEAEIRATSDHMLELLARLRALEDEKRTFPLGSDDFIRRAEDAERLSRTIFRWSGLQMNLAERSGTAVRQGRMPPRPIAAVEPRRLDQILALWREAQILLEIAKPGSPEAAAAANDVERLRDEYHATADARRADEASVD